MGKVYKIEDHPRVCGENRVTWYIQKTGLGSPPRVRGKRMNPRMLVVAERITPACAGKTEAVTDYSVALRDHPRVCGENYRYQSRRSRESGSPPRVRGKPQINDFQLPFVRITPACAGKT